MAVVRELFELIQGLANGTYPRFVTRNDLGGELPVFLYHKVDPEQMTADFSYLRSNDYTSLDAAGHMAALDDTHHRVERSVVITYDDGLEDLYTRAFPLLVEHRMKAIAFIIPSLVGTPDMVTWDQVREMHDSGLVDIQSHSMHHAAIPTSSVIEDFFHPNYPFYRQWDIPVDAAWETGVPALPPAPGRPIWAHGSRLEDAPRFIPDPTFEGAFATYVEAEGGARVFDQQGWRDRLKAVATPDANSSAAPSGRFETGDEQRAAVRAELVTSRERIEAELPGAAVRYLAYPWHLYGQVTLGLLDECGYDGAYAGLTQYKGGPGSADRPARFELARLSGDFIACLPGEGRRSLLSVLGSKIFRRVTSGRPY